MSGQSVPYHLRPHKSVDRRLFLDLLARYERWRPLSRYAYVSMGAYPLEDLKLAFRLLGITRLVSFDLDEDVVSRQIFNRPVETCRCIQRKSGEIVSGLERILKECEINDAIGVVVWLDYTDPGKLGEQIREFETLLNRLAPGDIVRVTVNAAASPLGSSTGPDGKHRPAPELRAMRLQKLRERIADYLPSQTNADQITDDGLPGILGAAFGAAALRAFPPGLENSFVPLSIVRYADGQQMLSVTGTVVPRGDEMELRRKLDLEAWPFASATWTDVHRIVVPALTVRERLFLERGIMSEPASALIAQLGFKSASDVNMEEFLDSFRSYCRFYPTLLSTEL